jgi:enolase-phosphatase E1
LAQPIFRPGKREHIDTKSTLAILLDIEGTTTPICFVHETLFPYARRQLQGFLESHWQDPDVRTDIEDLRRQYQVDKSQAEAPPSWQEDSDAAQQASALAYANWLMDRDSKCTPLKSLQGKIWKEGYARGSLKSEVFADVPAAFLRWSRQRKTISIFSSGSVLAQKLLFVHTTSGDLTSSIFKYFDTTTGRKTASESYRKIAKLLDVPAASVLFVSDTVEELDAATHAYMQTALCVRGDNISPAKSNHKLVRTFDEIDFPTNR